MNKLKIIIAIIVITILGGFFRIYQIEKYPVHLGHDEVTQLYDAISISQTGKDVYGNSYPFIFKSINDNKPPFYTYTTVLFYKIFGWNDFTIRFPAVIFGTLMIPAVFLFVNQLFKQKYLALIATLFTAIAPYEIFYSRKSFENQAGILLIILAITLLKRYVDDNSKKVSAFTGAILFSLASYTYFSHAILIPIIFLAFMIIYLNKTKKSFWKLLMVFVLFVIPLWYLIIKTPEARQRSKDVFVVQDVQLGNKIEKLEDYGLVVNGMVRTYEVARFGLKKYISHLDPYFLFVNGLEMTDWEAVGVGPLFVIQFPLVLLGLFSLLRKKALFKEKLFLLSLIIIGMIPAGLTFEEKSPHRIIIVFTIINIISAFGLLELIKLVKRLSITPIAKKLTYSVFGIAILFNLFYFYFIYTRSYPIEKSHFIHYPFKQVSEYVWENYDNYEQIVFDPKFGRHFPFIGTGSHYYLGYYGKYQPADFQTDYRKGNEKQRETILGNIHIRAVNWPAEKKNLTDALIIASPWSLPIDIEKRANIIDRFNFYQQDKVAFYAIEL